MKKLGVSVILQDKSEKFLLQLRDDKKDIINPNRWALFGGSIEEGELPIDAAIREMKEELNLKLKRTDLSLKYTYSNTVYHKHYVYLSKVKVNPKKLILYEGRAMKLFSRKQIIFMRRVVLRTRLGFIFHKIT